MSSHGVTVLGFIPSGHELGAAVFSLVDHFLDHVLGFDRGRGGDADDFGPDRGLDGLDRHCCWR